MDHRHPGHRASPLKYVGRRDRADVHVAHIRAAPRDASVAARVCHGALFRFPELNIAVIENGATWLPALLDILADVYKGRRHRGLPIRLGTSRKSRTCRSRREADHGRESGAADVGMTPGPTTLDSVQISS